MRCPKCKKESNQVKDGFTNASSQRYRCKECGARYTPEKKPQGYPKEICELAIRMYTDGLNFRQIGRHLKISHTTVMCWVKDHAEKLPEAPVPEDAYSVEMDELYTFIEEKKTGSTS
ncbi:MAG: IS1 family transposase [Deltaproteobacteria bacterium]|jgi:transposase|nr:IS1 family transposase [Deltaproteobacteria bacterium]